ncbi:MAG: ECF-type sigma factor [Planctomycetota bacterium]|nr:ECF-type sigma factor [Planctomycetota bacterium]
MGGADVCCSPQGEAQSAGAVMRGERPDHTLQPTAVVGEVWLRALAAEDVVFATREAFLGFAARTMRHVLIDHARRRNAIKRGAGKVERLGNHEPGAGAALASAEADREDVGWLLALEDELNRLEVLDSDAARVVELRFFGGLTVEEAASVLGVSGKTVQNRWATARAWLRGRLDDGHADTRRV